MPSIPLNYLSSPWLDSTCSFLAHCSARLLIPTIPLPAPQRQQDNCIMNCILDLNLPESTMIRVNSCRLWLQVTMLSDICNLKGNQIDRQAWLGLSPMPSSTADWPVQARPHDIIWGIWRKALSDSVCTNENRYVLASKPGLLKVGLGAWLHASSPRHSPRWTSFIEQSTQRLFTPDPLHPEHFLQLSTATRVDFSLATYDLRAPTQHIPRTELPADAVPVLTTTDGVHIRINRSTTPFRLGAPPPAPPTRVPSSSRTILTLSQNGNGNSSWVRSTLATPSPLANN
jgi:hypothetical protein